MTIRIGLGLASDAVRAVAVRQQRIVWAAEAPLEVGTDPGPVIESLLKLAPVRRFSRPVLSAAIGPHASQMKVLTGLPTLKDSPTLTALIRENAGSFFLRNGVPLVTTTASVVSSGVALGGAIEEPCVRTVREVCGALRWRLGSIAPTHAVLGRVVTDNPLVWADGELLIEVTQSNNSIQSVRTRRRTAADTSLEQLQPVSTLAALGEGAVGYADAYGAAILDTADGLGIDSGAATGWSGVELRRGLLLPSLLLALGVLSLLISPLASVRAGNKARARLVAVQPDQKQVIVSTLARLDSVSAILDGSRRFAASRSLVTPTLGLLARELPDGCMLANLELSDQEGSLTALCSEHTGLLGTLQNLPGARNVELPGQVERETAGGRQLQRLRVRWRRGAP
jgi:hypothetical protein